jgi:hypothetical protein
MRDFMKASCFIPLLLLTAVAAFFSPILKLLEALPRPQTANSSPTQGPIVYVSDFELDIFPGRMKPRPAPRPASGSATTALRPASSDRPSDVPPTAQPNTSSAPSSKKPTAARTADSQSDDNPVARAHALVNAVSENIVSALQKGGYNAKRLWAGEPLPDKGLRIRGVFAEADERNRARRLLYGSDSAAPRMILYVGVNNLAQPGQPLYEIASPPGTDSKYGPIITVTPYSPASRFELAKDPTDEEITKIAKQIAVDLGSLLSANPLLTTE